MARGQEERPALGGSSAPGPRPCTGIETQMMPKALTKAERTRATAAHGGSLRLLRFLGASAVVHGLLAVVLSREAAPRSVLASRPPASLSAIVWFESPALAPSSAAAPPVGGPAVGRASALVAPSASRSRLTPAKRAPVEPSAAPRVAPESAPPASEVKPPLAEPPPGLASTEAERAPQDAAAQTVAGAAAAERAGTGAVSLEGVVSTPGGEGSRSAAGSAGATELVAYARQLSRVVGRQRRYPASAARFGMEGTARLQVSVNRDGALAGAPRLVRSSGHEVLDAEALRMVEAAAPFAPLPEGHARPSAEFVIPVDFSLRPQG